MVNGKSFDQFAPRVAHLDERGALRHLYGDVMLSAVAHEGSRYAIQRSRFHDAYRRALLALQLFGVHEARPLDVGVGGTDEVLHLRLAHGAKPVSRPFALQEVDGVGRFAHKAAAPFLVVPAADEQQVVDGGYKRAPALFRVAVGFVQLVAHGYVILDMFLSQVFAHQQLFVVDGLQGHPYRFAQDVFRHSYLFGFGVDCLW